VENIKKILIVYTLIVVLFAGCAVSKDARTTYNNQPSISGEQESQDDKERLEAERLKLKKEKALKEAEEKAALEALEKEKLETERKIKEETEAKAKSDAEKRASEQAKAEQAKPKAATPAPVPQQNKPAPTPAPKLEPKPTPKSTPTPSPTQTPAPTNTKPVLPNNVNVEYWAEIENEVLRLCNIERAKAGVKPLQGNEALREIARYKSNDMLQNNYFNHVSPSGVQPWDLAKIFGYSYTTFGENIWMMSGSSNDPSYETRFRAIITAEKIVTDWMNSPGHRANILNAKFGRLGVGIAYSPKALKGYATQAFSN
jgi:uncharacterized protein YkwD